MQPAVGSTVVEGGLRRGTGGDGTAGAYGWQGATLRPTGVVVFATLDQPHPRPLRVTVQGNGPGLLDAPAPRATLPAAHGHRAVPAPGAVGRHVLRAAAWLLGR
jgi:hypothetical protein